MRSYKTSIFELIVSNSKSPYYPSPKIPNESMMSTMPPSHLIDAYQVIYDGYEYGEYESKGYKYAGYSPKGRLIARINEEILALQVEGWKENEPDKIGLFKDAHRFALSSDAAIENDRDLKIDKWQTNYATVLSSIFSDPAFKAIQSIGYGCAEYWAEQYASSMYYGDHTYGYVKTHGTSHPAPRITWNQVLKYQEMGNLYSFTKDIAIDWKDNFRDTGDWSLDQRTVNFGNRTRSPDIDMFISYVIWLLTRNRQIGFATGISSLNAFVDHNTKVKVLRHIFDIFEDLIDCKIYCPKTEGGWIYSELRRSYLDKMNLVHYDVAGMELITPSLIQGRLGQLDYGIGITVGYLKMIPELLSGVSCTSDWDMIAHLILLAYLLIGKKKPEYIVILGDDCTLVYDGEPPEIDSVLYGRQIRDDKLVRTLGLTTCEFMHPVGLNYTIDRADKRINLRDNWGKWINNAMGLPERVAIAQFFTGFINEVPVHEILEKAPMYDFVYSPKEMVLIQLGLVKLDDEVVKITKMKPNNR